MSEMITGTHDLEAGDLDILNMPTMFCSAADIDHSVMVYLQSKRILKAVNDNSTLCEMQEPEGCRNVQFIFCRNHVPHIGHLKNILRENYIIRIDYMVGTVGGGRRCATASCGRKGFKRAPNKSRRVWPAAEGQYGTARHPCSAEQTWRTSATMSGKSTADGPTLEPTVYLFSGRKGTVMQVFVSSAMVEAREGQTIREVTVTVDCFYRDGRTVLSKLSQVLQKKDIVNIDYRRSSIHETAG
ncbi:uncharacterized protein LOC142584334 [Dermacentor variabilis]|uniref:uncharacterized protein LOC142584334 n=1 Tax=Dermacentor variabilis TaxID=34621 RepID=UPI003F5BA6A5